MSDADNRNEDAKEVASRSLIKVSVLVVVTLLAVVAWLAFDFLLLLFAAILFGVLINGISCWISEKHLCRARFQWGCSSSSS